MKKFTFSIIFFLLVMMSGSIIVLAEGKVNEAKDVSVIIDGKKTTFEDPLITINDRTLIPLRSLAISLGLPNDSNHIIWNSNENSVVLKDKTFEIKLSIDNKDAYLNSKPINLDVAPVIYNDKTYIPVRFVSQSFGRKVTWDEKSKSILISTEEQYKNVKQILDTVALKFNEKDKYQYTKIINDEKEKYTVNSVFNIDKKAQKAQATYTVKSPYVKESDTFKIDEWCQDDIRYLRISPKDTWNWTLMESNDQINVYSFLSRLSNNELASTGLVIEQQSQTEITLKGDIFLDDIFLSESSSAGLTRDQLKGYISSANTVIKIDKNTSMVTEATLTLKLKSNIGSNAYVDDSTLTVTLKDFNFAVYSELKSPDNLVQVTQEMRNKFWLDLGENYLLYNKIDEAIRLFDKVLSNDPKNGQAYYDKGKVLLKQGKIDEAAELYEKAVSLDPKLAKIYVELGKKLVQLKNEDKALIYFDKAINAGINSSDAYYNKGEILYKAGKYEEALGSYAEAIKISPSYYNSIVNKIFNFRISRKYDIALKYCDKLIELKPDNPSAYYEKAQILYYMKKYDEALGALDSAEKLSPNNALATSILGTKIMIYKALGKEDSVNEAVNKALDIEAKTSSEYNNKGNILLSIKRYEDAIACFDKAIELDPLDPTAYYNKGLSLYYLNRFDEANKSLDKAIEVDPTYISAYYWKAIVLEKLGRYDEAKKYYDKYNQFIKK